MNLGLLAKLFLYRNILKNDFFLLYMILNKDEFKRVKNCVYTIIGIFDKNMRCNNFKELSEYKCICIKVGKAGGNLLKELNCVKKQYGFTHIFILNIIINPKCGIDYCEKYIHKLLKQYKLNIGRWTTTSFKIFKEAFTADIEVISIINKVIKKYKNYIQSNIKYIDPLDIMSIYFDNIAAMEISESLPIKIIKILCQNTKNYNDISSTYMKSIVKSYI